MWREGQTRASDGSGYWYQIVFEIDCDKFFPFFKLGRFDIGIRKQNIEPQGLVGKIFWKKKLAVHFGPIRLRSALISGTLERVFAHALSVRSLYPRSRLFVTRFGFFVGYGCGKEKRPKSCRRLIAGFLCGGRMQRGVVPISAKERLFPTSSSSINCFAKSTAQEQESVVTRKGPLFDTVGKGGVGVTD